MKSFPAEAWQKLWQQHHRTKSLLNIFAYKRDNGQPSEQGQANDQQQDMPGNGNNDEDPPELKKPGYTKAQLVGLILGPLLFTITMLFLDPEGLSAAGRSVLAVTLWVATWWVTEALPIPATSLLPLFLIPMTGALDGDTVASAYGDDVIFLFLGGFFIATAMEKWNLHQRIALGIIAAIGTSTQRILLGFMVATGFLSMWVSNTAAVMMMIPMGLAITAQVAESLKDTPEEKELPRFEKALIFGIGYAGTIGGIGTLIGTPPNIILAGQMDQLFGVTISFATWMLFGVPVVIILLAATWLYLGRMQFKTSIKQLPGGQALIQKERTALGKISYEESMVAFVFSFAAFMWVTREFLWDEDEGLVLQIPGISDGTIAILAAVLLFAIPAKSGISSRILDWSDSKEIPWGVLLLFGGGLAIAAGFTGSGLSEWIGDQLTVLEGFHIFVIILATAVLIMALTEITSNTATATMILPVVASLALALDVHPFALMFPAALAANCAFMLPVGTPPNAIIYATGKLRIIEMVRAGFAVNIYATMLIVLAVYYLVPIVWGIDLMSFPQEFMN